MKTSKKFQYVPNYSLVARFIFTLVLLLGNIVSIVSAESLYRHIEPFDLYRYGSGYDISAERQVKSGQLCINFVLDPQNMIEDHTGNGLKHSHDSITRTYELVDKMNLSVSAQMKSITAEVNAGLDILKTVETHRFSQTDIFWAYNVFNTVALKPETLSYKSDIQALLESDINGTDKFFARCGDAFVIGMKNSGYYYGISYVEEKKSTSNKKTKLTFDFKYNSETSYEAAIDYEKSRVEKESLKKIKILVETSDTTLSGKKPDTLQKLKEQWSNFTPSKESAQPISLVLAPYSVIGTDQPGVLEESQKEIKLKVLLRALWDLRTMKQEMGYILNHEKEFAFGLPKHKRLIELRKNHLMYIKKSWRDEYDSLLIDTKSCIKNFTETCEKLAAWYDDHPRITERNILPKKYKNSCYGEFVIIPDFKDAKINSFARIKGDNEMGKSPIKVTSTLSLYPDERQLKLKLKIQAEQTKKDFSTFVVEKSYVVFDLDPKHPEIADFFQECEFANSPINKKTLQDVSIYGKISRVIDKDPRNFVPIEGSGILKGMSCKLDDKGHDNEILECKDIEISNFQVVLQSKLDREALGWSASKLVVAPTLKSLDPRSRGGGRLKLPVKTNKLPGKML